MIIFSHNICLSLKFKFHLFLFFFLCTTRVKWIHFAEFQHTSAISSLLLASPWCARVAVDEQPQFSDKKWTFLLTLLEFSLNFLKNENKTIKVEIQEKLREYFFFVFFRKFQKQWKKSTGEEIKKKFIILKEKKDIDWLWHTIISSEFTQSRENF